MEVHSVKHIDQKGESKNMQKDALQILNEVRKVIVGKDLVIAKVFMAILSKGHVLLEDVPGVGKTTLALSFSKVLGLDYRRIQFTSDSVPSDIVGFSIYDKKDGDFKYKAGAAMTNLLLADEINRTSSKTQSALLEVMEEGQMTVDGITRKVPEPFIVLATQNPVGSAGTQMLPNSQMDRFMVKLQMGYPDIKSQINILKERHRNDPLDNVHQVTSKQQLLMMQKAADAVHIADSIYDYVARLAEATRKRQDIQLGISPRGTLALCRMAKSYAFIKGRDYVVPEDVVAVFKDVCGHRIILSSKAKISAVKEEEILTDILKHVPVPAIKSNPQNSDSKKDEKK